MAAEPIPVAIVGAGPSGLTAALFLGRQGIPVTVFERESEIFEDPRAATFHPPTLEMYEPVGITRRLHAAGIIAPKWHYRDRRGGVVAEFDLSILAGETRFPYRLQCEQHKLCRMLREALADYPSVTLRYSMPVKDVRQDAEGVDLVVGPEDEVRRATYVIGADGGRSVVRKSQAIEFVGFTYLERFLVITTSFDFAAAGFVFTNYVSDPEEWSALFKVPGKGPPGIWRVVFPVPPDEPEAALLSVSRAQERLQGLLPQATPYEIVHVNLYQVHQRVAERFREGRVFLDGDAAHVNNPLGGMGMNFGIHDAVSLAEKLGAVLRGESGVEVLDRYDRQRRFVADAFLQAMTIQNKKLLEERDPERRRENQASLRQTVGDPTRAHAFLMKTAMIEGVRAAAAIP